MNELILITTKNFVSLKMDENGYGIRSLQTFWSSFFISGSCLEITARN